MEIKDKELSFSSPQELLDYVGTIRTEEKERLWPVLDILRKSTPKEFLAQLVNTIIEKCKDPQLDPVTRDWYSYVKSVAQKGLGRLSANDQRYLQRQKEEHGFKKVKNVDFGDE